MIEINNVAVKRIIIDHNNKFPFSKIFPKSNNAILSIGIFISMGLYKIEYTKTGKPIPIHISKIFEP